jgi:hypothetical protein
MPTPPEPEPPVGERLHELARLLRGARHLRPEDQQSLADLLDELAGELRTTAPSPQADHLAESAAHLAMELNEHRDLGLLGSATERLKDAAARAETKAPVATGVARQLIDILADLGI